MISFESDYIQGAHPEILRRFVETNMETLSGYGNDKYTESAKEKIRKACDCPEAEVYFLTGGTQTNQTVISTLIRSFDGVISAKTGHINAHEAGAIEYTGHKVLELPGYEGKIEANDLKVYIETFYRDENHTHMVFPGMVYISHPTEYGTLYTKSELAEISAICREYNLPLYMDGARLGYGIMSYDTDLTLAEIAKLCDVFYIGGTKVGALCGEAVVFTKKNMPEYFATLVKQRGAMIAKGRLIGLQFDTLFTDELYFKISKHAIDMAEKLKELFKSRGYEFFLNSPTNQQFIILDKEQHKRLSEKVKFSFWEELADGRVVVRFATSWATTEDDIAALSEII